MVLGVRTRPHPIPSHPGRIHITLCLQESRSCFYLIYLLCIFILLVPGGQADTLQRGLLGDGFQIQITFHQGDYHLLQTMMLAGWGQPLHSALPTELPLTVP